MIRIGGAIVIGVWILLTSFHAVGPQERAVVTTFGAYSRTMGSGIGLTLPYPIESVSKLNVAEIRTIDIPASGNTQNFILTGDQNLVDLSYLIRWNISDLALYKYQLGDPRNALLEIGEAAMRAAVARQKLDEVLTGEGRAEVEQDVRAAMQRNVQTLQALQPEAPSPASWVAPAEEVLRNHREWVRLEWRDPGLQLRVGVDSVYRTPVFARLGRDNALADVEQACALARRTSAAAYAPSSFVSVQDGVGLEVMELCLPVYQGGRLDGFLVASYALVEML